MSDPVEADAPEVMQEGLIGRVRVGRHGLRVRGRFLVVLLVLVPTLLAVGFVRLQAITRMSREVRHLYDDNVTTGQLTTELTINLNHAEEVALQLIPTRDPGNRARLDAQLDETIIAQVNAEIETLRRLHANDPLAGRLPVQEIGSRWGRFLRLRQDGLLNGTAATPIAGRGSELLARRVADVFRPITSIAARLAKTELGQAKQADLRTQATYRHSRLLILGLAIGSLLSSLGVVLWLIRSIVPRTRDYSRFAAQVATGELGTRLRPTGRDELTELGEALNSMVEQRQAERDYEETQTEFNDTMQVAEREDEAHEFLRRHLERSIPGSSVVVLNRNNSADRLEARTALPPRSQLSKTLTDARPRSCLAVRFGRVHDEGPGRQPLLSCEVCGKSPQLSTCHPLLVSGEVIGSVLIKHPRPLAEEERHRTSTSVSQAAPVIANLRNLAITELRAATDALTGLPNNRSVHDTIKRMVAQASRTITPLAAALLDLDHFKQINDIYGHGAGDDVLAAVGATLRSTVREGDFVGRYGGEEFLILFPATAKQEAMIAAEKLRAAIATITIPTVDRPITASIGIAVLPDDAGEAAGLMRSADRALYSAKNKGRNRVETATTNHTTPNTPEPPTATNNQPQDGRTRLGQQNIAAHGLLHAGRLSGARGYLASDSWPVGRRYEGRAQELMRSR